MILEADVYDYGKGKVNVRMNTNCFHVKIVNRSNKEVLFERGFSKPIGNEWLDEDHERITKALDALEKAVLLVSEKEIDKRRCEK